MSDKEKIVIRRDNAPDISFVGERIGYACSSDSDTVGSCYSGSVGRWAELELYDTSAGSYVCSEISHTSWLGERDKFRGAVCADTAGVIEFFGHRWLAKELYDNAGIEDVETVD
ncbi:MAG: hypothetical protein RPU41_00635 [Candidatus Sedimenticola sp. (ex Thyasira tokunagai)]